MRPRILIIEDDIEWSDYLAGNLSEFHETIVADTGAKGLKLIESSSPNCIILDLALPDYKNEEELPLLRELLNQYPHVPVVILTGRDDTSLAVKAARIGAYDYISKGHLDKDKFLTTIRNAVEKNCLQLRFRESIEEELEKYPLIGKSPAIVTLRETIRKAAPSDEPVLITGETGTGKEIVARHLHYYSKRTSGRFVVASIPGHSGTSAYSELFGHRKGAYTGADYARLGKFGVANGGTLFLDDVDLYPPDVQGMLLRVLEDGIFTQMGSDEEYCVDVRIIAATNQDLKRLPEEGKFRKDLFYRLSSLKIDIPPLRERVQDIGLLARFFLEQEIRESKYRSCRLSDEALSLMRDYEWPGNVRELKQTIKSLFLLTDSDVIEADEVANQLDIPREEALEPGTLKGGTAHFQREFIERKLIEHDKNISQTSQALEITRQHLQRLIKSLGIEIS